MEELLANLNPSVRAEVERVINDDPQMRARLESRVRQYADSQGNLPDGDTADWAARSFLSSEGVNYVSARSAYGGSGLKPATLGALTGGAVAVGTAAGAVVLGSKAIDSYATDVAAYAMGLNPRMLREVRRAVQMTQESTDWTSLARSLAMGWDQDLVNEHVVIPYTTDLLSRTTGVTARAAWRGARSGLFHSEREEVGDLGELNDWVGNYMGRVAETQGNLLIRTLRSVVDRSMREGDTPGILRRKMMRSWNLSPRHAQAVDNLRAGLKRQGVKRPQIERQVGTQARRLLDSRLRSLSQTEVMTAFNLGREHQWRQDVLDGLMAPDTVKMWVTARDELVCPTCRPMDGEMMALGQQFIGPAGQVFVPPIHPNCRCLVIPVSAHEAEVANFSDSFAMLFPKNQQVAKHMGPGPHPGSGTPQIVHSGGEAAEDVRMAAYLNSLDQEHLDPEEFIDEFGPRAKKFYEGVMQWATSFDDVAQLRAMLDGDEDPSKVRKQRKDTEALQRLAEVVHRAPSNTPELYRGMAIKAPMNEVKEMFPKGDVYNPTIASFTTDKQLAEMYAVENVIKPLRRGNVSVNLILSEGARGVHIEPLSRNEFSILGDLSEWVVADDLVVEDVDVRDDHHIDVHLRPASVAKSQHNEMVSALLEFPFYALHDVSKHLAGTEHDHDQSEHAGGGESEGFTIPGSTWLGAGVATAMAGVGIIALRRLPMGVSIVPDRVARTTTRRDSLLSGELDKIATRMNRGENPNVPWVEEAVEMTKGSTTGLRAGYEGGSLPNSLWRFSEMVSKAPSANRPLQRGMFQVDDAVYNSYQTGRSFTLAPSSFASDPNVARAFSGQGQFSSLPKNSVVMHADSSTRGLQIEQVWAQLRNMPASLSESEYLVSGAFRIRRVQDVDGIRHVYLTQTGRLDYGTRAQWVAKVIADVSKHLGPGDHPSGSSQDVHGSGGDNFLSNLDTEWRPSAAESMGAGLAAATALATRGRIRGRLRPNVYNQIQGGVPSRALDRSLRRTFETNAAGMRSEISSIRVGDAPHHTASFQALAETMGDGGRLAQQMQRFFTRRNNIRVEGVVRDANNAQVGTFDVAIDPRTREAFQYGMFLEPRVQGGGFAGQWTTHVGTRFVETGINRVGALASSDVGGYAWAARGFEWRYGPSPWVMQSVEAVRQGQNQFMRNLHPETMREIESVSRRLKTGFVTTRFPSPQEIANIGRSRPYTHPRTGRETWAGREIMLGTQWHASLNLRQIRRILQQEGAL